MIPHETREFCMWLSWLLYFVVISLFHSITLCIFCFIVVAVSSIKYQQMLDRISDYVYISIWRWYYDVCFFSLPFIVLFVTQHSHGRAWRLSVSKHWVYCSGLLACCPFHFAQIPALFSLEKGSSVNVVSANFPNRRPGIRVQSNLFSPYTLGYMGLTSVRGRSYTYD